MCILFSIFITSLGISYRKQLDVEIFINESLQGQIDILTTDNVKLRDTEIILGLKLKETHAQVIASEEQSEAMAVQMNSLIDKGSWSLRNGIATAYSPFDNINGIEADANPTKTSIGLLPGAGIIAVDPKRIPYKSEMMVVYADGRVYKGIAGDTGGALRNSKKYHVDIFKQTFTQANKHGVQNVMILWKPPKQ